MNLETLEAIRAIGLGAVLAIGSFGLLVYLIKHFLKSIDSERDRWMNIAENHIKNNAEVSSRLCNQIESLSKSTEDAHKYQRDEHKEMIKILSKLNGNE